MREFCQWLTRKNGLSTDHVDDLLQESVLAELSGEDGKAAARRLAQRLARRSRHDDLQDDLQDDLAALVGSDDLQDDLAALVGSDDLAFALSVLSGQTSRHEGTVSRRFSKIVKNARSKAGLPTASVVSAG